MNLARRPLRDVETVDRRVLGAFRFVDAVTGVAVAVPPGVSVLRMQVAGTPGEIPLAKGAVRLVENRRGMHVIFGAPFFDAYTRTFLDPQPPAETAAGPLRLIVSLADAGPQYLPQEFRLELPRALDPAAADSVLRPIDVGLFRSPAAPVLDGWAVLRVQVTEAGTNPAVALPGVLIRVFRTTPGAPDVLVGEGMTEWRGGVRGEALVPLAGIRRFRPGAGVNVVETDQPIAFEAVRDPGFTGSAGQLPDIARIRAAAPAGIFEIVRPPPPVRVQAGREYTVHLAMA